MRLDIAHYTNRYNYTKTHFSNNPIISGDMPLLRQLVIEPHRPRFNLGPVYVESVIHKVAPGNIFFSVLQL